jgi:alkanesulfonate monooxygenase SsuD/methylene tetrahydromethanopterin reductase-like flavin-dependent oxidoreductase (luciferase family)
MTGPDYRHPLQFGVSLTPRHDAADAVVALAQRSERLGYDLVTFQDHPYQPWFLDTWTLLTWVASRTDRIRVAGNVLNVPMRPPAVLARAAVSLDQLSGGRFDLALGAGGFWDAIEAMGGRRLTPGQAVQALEEARRKGTVRHHPRHLGCRRSGAAAGTRRVPPPERSQAGPAPAHRIPVWIGAYRPRMQRPEGRWLAALARPARAGRAERREPDHRRGRCRGR